MRYCRTVAASLPHYTYCFVVGFASSNMLSSSDCHFQKTSSRQHWGQGSRCLKALESCGSFEDLTATSQLPGLFLACVLSKPTLDFAILYLYVSIGSHDSGLLLDSNFACQEKLQAAPFFPAPSAVQLSALRCLTFLDASQNKIRTLELMAQTHFKATFLEHGGKMSEI